MSADLPIDHEEAKHLALIKQNESNLARCYLESSQRISEMESVLNGLHATLCEEVERLFDAKPGSPREAMLKLWVMYVEAIEKALGHDKGFE